MVPEQSLDFVAKMWLRIRTPRLQMTTCGLTSRRSAATLLMRLACQSETAQVKGLLRAFGHAADPRKGPSTVKYGMNSKKIWAARKTLLQFYKEIWNYIDF